MPVQVFWNIADWVQAIADLPTKGPLPVRTVLVPRERVAHVLRRELVRTGHSDLLIGTRFATPLAMAIETLTVGDVPFRQGEETLRSARLKEVFRQDLALAYFSSRTLQDVPGWPDAFARTLLDLESAGLRPDDLPVTRNPRFADIATLWRAADEAAGESWTSPRILCAAAEGLENKTLTWPTEGPVLAPIADDTSFACARFVRSIPKVATAVLGARPLNAEALHRVQELLGPEARQALEGASAPCSAGSERDLLSSYLFASIDTLADPARPRSIGPDGTVHLEEHAGVETEIEAAVDWVARQVIEADVPLEEIAVLMPTTDPLAGMLADRLARLPWTDGTLPVHVAGGLPLSGTAAGARALAVLRALSSHLGVGDVADALPALRIESTDRNHLSRASAVQCIAALGAVGGSAADPAGALSWTTRIAERLADLEKARADTEATVDSDDARERGEAQRIRQLLADLGAARPALEGLADIASAVLSGETLDPLANRICSFLKEFLLEPGQGTRIWSLLQTALEDSRNDMLAKSLAGAEALDWIHGVLQGIRIPTVRFGLPAVYIGDVSGATGLAFTAVRILGLSEGTIPPSVAEDPVLPGTLRAELAPGRLVTPADRALFAVHALDRAVRSASSSVALSAPRSDLGGVQREPSSVLLEAAAALGRPNATNGTPAPVIPDLKGLRRDGFVPARRDAVATRLRIPVSEAALLDKAASETHAGTVHPSWLDTLASDLDRIRRLLAPDGLGPADGVMEGSGPLPDVPGLDPEHPMSASRLRRLLECPHAFLLENLLHLGEPETPELLLEIDARSYGTLFHDAAAAFYKAHGPEFGARHRSLPEWMALADVFANDAFDAFIRWYPLVGQEVVAQQRRRLRHDIGRLMRHDWNGGHPRKHHGVEVPFGFDGPVIVPGHDHPGLHARGYIDRVEVDGGRTLVQDLKTGRAKPRTGKTAGPNPVIDLQIALYGMVVRQLANRWGLPEEVGAAYIHLAGSAGVERAFLHDYDALEAAATKWIDAACDLLKARAFPRTPDENDCKYCPFSPVCGLKAAARSAMLLAEAGDACAAYLNIRTAQQDEEVE